VRGPQPKRRSRGKGGGVPSWLSVALISALILGGLTMIAIGLTKDDNNEQPPAAPPAGQAPAKGQKPAQNQGQAQTPAAPQEETAVPEEGAAPALNRKNFARFSIGVPTGWQNGNEGEGVAITAPGSTAEIVVISQQGSFSQDQLAQGARGVLAQRHQGAQIGSPKPVRIGAQKGLRVVATYPGGEEAAIVISARGFSHLIVQRVDRGASPDLSQQADAALASFKPR